MYISLVSHRLFKRKPTTVFLRKCSHTPLPQTWLRESTKCISVQTFSHEQNENNNNLKYYGWLSLSLQQMANFTECPNTRKPRLTWKSVFLFCSYRRGQIFKLKYLKSGSKYKFLSYYEKFRILSFIWPWLHFIIPICLRMVAV